MSSKSGALRWAQDRERHLLQHGAQPPHKEVPTLREFARRYIEGHAIANRQKPSAIASKEAILRTHLLPTFGALRLDAINNEQVQRLKLQLQDKAPRQSTTS